MLICLSLVCLSIYASVSSYGTFIFILWRIEQFLAVTVEPGERQSRSGTKTSAGYEKGMVTSVGRASDGQRFQGWFSGAKQGRVTGVAIEANTMVANLVYGLAATKDETDMEFKTRVWVQLRRTCICG